MKTALLAALILALPASAHAQQNPLSDHNRLMWSGIKLWLVTSAEKMPEENFSFKPVEGVRTFGEIVGHAADGHYRFCSIVLGEKNPLPNIEKTRKTKAELITGLEEAIAYCDRAYSRLDDAAAVEMLNLGMPMPRGGVLTVNILHSTLHYGNLITYMRMKGVVPPSSDPAFMQPQRKNP
jgi:uncharacterized damage-inducible protein DinB